MTKSFILDTNVLLNDPMAPYKFGSHRIIIPMAVLEELDDIKMRKNDLSFDARAAIRVINDIIGDKDAVSGVGFNGGAVMAVVDYSADELIKSAKIAIEPSSNDNKIIMCALLIDWATEKGHKYSHGTDSAVLVSNDINLRLKAKGAGMKYAQEYKNDIVVEDADKLPEGIITVANDWLESIPTDKIDRKSCGNTVIKSEYMPEGDHLTVNTWLVPEDESWAAVITDFDNWTGEVLLNFKSVSSLMKRSCVGISPQSIKQAVAMDALLDRDIDIVVIDGAAGSGKTLMALAAATEMIKGKKTGYRHEKIIFTRTNVTDCEEIGFLTGDETAKMSPWLGAAFDNMDMIARTSKREDFRAENSIKDESKSFIELKAMMYFRGRSISYSFLVIDEAQNMNTKQMKTMISRAGEYCKVIVMGNNAQIDNPNVTARSSGLTHAMNKFHGQDFAQVIKLEGVVRSRLAAFAEEEL